MKRIINIFLALSLTLALTGCGKDFLGTKYYRGVDAATALNTPEKINTALTGVYSRFFGVSFAGNYAVNIGDVPTDISYWNTSTNHWNNLYMYTVNVTDGYLSNLWTAGYRIVDNSARIIKAGNELYADATPAQKKSLDQSLAEAYALRAYANLVMVNVFAHQVKVNGTDFSSSDGLVISEEPILPFAQVERSTIGATYTMILSDLNKALERFTAAGGDREDKCYIGVAAVHGLIARANLYLENWTEAKTAAQAALDAAGITTLTYTNADYKALYNGTGSNTESLFYLDINASQNYGANSCGTVWSSYNFSPSPKLQAMYASTDVRKAIMDMSATSTPAVPIYAGGKYAAYSSGNPAYATCNLVNAPEMFLILAEASLKLNSISDAQNALLVVAKRNTAIASTAGLPSASDALLQFIKDERARELFQEGLRLWDLRRWGDNVGVRAIGAPSVAFYFTDYNISNLVYPIPSAEINSGFGVTQNKDWNLTLPKRPTP